MDETPKEDESSPKALVRLVWNQNLKVAALEEKLKNLDRLIKGDSDNFDDDGMVGKVKKIPENMDDIATWYKSLHVDAAMKFWQRWNKMCQQQDAVAWIAGIVAVVIAALTIGLITKMTEVW